MGEVRQKTFDCHGRRKGRQGVQGPPWILKTLAKMVVFLVLSGKKRFNHFCPSWEILGKIPWCPPLEKILLTPMLAAVILGLV